VYPLAIVFLLSALKLIPPGSIGFLLACTILGSALFFLGRRRLARNALLVLYGSYLVLSVPWVAEGLANRLPRYAAFDSRDLRLSRSLDAIVVLDGDNRRGRVRTALELKARNPQAGLWVLGDQWVVDALTQGGIPASRIVKEATAETTRDQVARVRQLVARRPNRRIVVVASRLQMPRVAALARAASLDLALAASAIDDEPPTAGAWRFVPSYIALRVSRDALYEHAALAYYRWHGWI
jgi:uncharacterized SAM-binding protein YcdF (DUF218 family)